MDNKIKRKRILTFDGWQDREEWNYWRARDCASTPVFELIIFLIIVAAVCVLPFVIENHKN